MLWTPQEGRFLHQHNRGTAVATAIGTSVTTGAAASTKGTPVEIFASTNFDTYFIEVFVTDYATAAANSNACLDVLIGAATEEILIPDLLVGGAGGNDPSMTARRYAFPLYIPAGTRIAVQAAGQRVSTAMRAHIHLWGGDGSPPFRVGRKVTAYGISTVPFGTTLTPGTSGAEGSWTQIVASTSEDHFAVIPGFQPGDDTTKTDAVYFQDVGVGAATEEEIAQSYIVGINASEEQFGPNPHIPTFVDIPSGSRLTSRVSTQIATLDSGNYNATIYGVS